MAYVKCITAKNGFDIEVVSGVKTGSFTDITISSQKGKAPKCLQFWRSDDVTTSIFWLMWQSDFSYYATKYSVTASGSTGYYYRSAQVGSTITYAPAVMSVGDTSITVRCSSSSQSNWTWKYYVEFE